MVKKSNLINSLLVLSALAGAGFLFVQNRKLISEGVGGLLTRKPTPQAPTDKATQLPLRQAPLAPKDISEIMTDDRRRKTPTILLQDPIETPKRQPTRTQELSSTTGQVKRGTRRSRQLQENVRRPTFLSEREKVSKVATRRKFGRTERPTIAGGKVRAKGRVSEKRLFEAEERARKVFDARSITNF